MSQALHGIDMAVNCFASICFIIAVICPSLPHTLHIFAFPLCLSILFSLVDFTFWSSSTRSELKLLSAVAVSVFGQLPSSILAVLFRVAKCHGSIRVKILVSWGKSLEEHIVWLNQAFFENVCKISVYKLAKLEEWSTAVLLLVLFRFSTKTVAIYAFFFG